MADTINQISNEIGAVPVSFAIGFVTGQGIGLLARKKPLSPFTILVTAGSTFISYGYVTSNNFEFIETDLMSAWNEIVKIPEAIISTIEGVFGGTKKKKETTFFGIPI